MVSLWMILLTTTLLENQLLVRFASNPQGDKAFIHAKILADGFTLSVSTRQTPIAVGLNALADNQIHGFWIPHLPPQQGAQIYLYSSQRLQKIALHTDDATTSIALHVQSPLALLTARLFIPLRLPYLANASFSAFTHAEEQLAYNPQDAANRFHNLKKDYVLQSWASLREVDALLLANHNTTTACSGYQRVAAQFNERTAAKIALIRSRILDCAIADDPNQSSPTLDIEALTRRVAPDDQVAKLLRDEIVFMLTNTTDLQILLHALPLAASRLGVPSLRQLAARVLVIAPAQITAQIGEKLLQETLYHHDTVDFLRFVALARCDLQMLPPTLAETMPTDPFAAEIQACHRYPFLALAPEQNNQDSTDISLAVANLQQRLALLKRKVNP